MRQPILRGLTRSKWISMKLKSAPKALRQCLILALLALIPAAGSALFHPKRPSWDPNALREGEVYLAKVQAWQGVLWLDARTHAEFDKDHVPGALLLNEDAWEELFYSVLQVWQPGQPVVVYCDERRCRSSHEVAQRLKESGMEQVYVLKGGWETWLKAQKPK